MNLWETNIDKDEKICMYLPRQDTRDRLASIRHWAQSCHDSLPGVLYACAPRLLKVIPHCSSTIKPENWSPKLEVKKPLSSRGIQIQNGRFKMALHYRLFTFRLHLIILCCCFVLMIFVLFSLMKVPISSTPFYVPLPCTGLLSNEKSLVIVHHAGQVLPSDSFIPTFSASA